MRMNMMSRAGSSGFSLVEMMISLVLSLIVVGAATTLVVSVVKANSETVQATRLTQELRALMGVIGREVMRARYMNDPLANVGRAALSMNPNGVIDDETAGCLRFSYFDPDPNRDGSSADAAHRAVAIRLNNNAIFAIANNVAPATPPVPTLLPECAAANVRLSSPELSITGFDIQVLDDTAAAAPAVGLAPGQEEALVFLEIRGQLVGDTSGLAISRRVSERMRIGSSRLSP